MALAVSLPPRQNRPPHVWGWGRRRDQKIVDGHHRRLCGRVGRGRLRGEARARQQENKCDGSGKKRPSDPAVGPESVTISGVVVPVFGNRIRRRHVVSSPLPDPADSGVLRLILTTIIPSPFLGHRPMSEICFVVCPILTPVFVRCLTYRTNTGPKIRQTATRVSDGSRYRRPAGRFTVGPIREEARLQGEIRRRHVMKSSTKDQAEGTFHGVKGKAKEI